MEKSSTSGGFPLAMFEDTKEARRESTPSSPPRIFNQQSMGILAKRMQRLLRLNVPPTWKMRNIDLGYSYTLAGAINVHCCLQCFNSHYKSLFWSVNTIVLFLLGPHPLMFFNC